jgi:uncharacterized MnhB-related membrane protein/mannitol/fructose-specific phosphotransferase system IIA component (Ntr-type)
MVLSQLLLFFMLVAAIVLVAAPRLIHSLMALCIFSSLLTLQYVFFRAPDVAITEAALGAGLSTLVYLTAIRKTATPPQPSPPDAGQHQPELKEETRMIALQDYIKPDNIYAVTSRKRDQIIQETIRNCLHDMAPGLVQGITHEILARKRSINPMDMNLGKGFALIHARNDACHEVHFALGLLPEPRNLYKGDKVHTIISIVLPSSQSRQYLAFLARFGRLMYAPESAALFEEAGKLFAVGQTGEAKEKITAFVHTFEEA